MAATREDYESAKCLKRRVSRQERRQEVNSKQSSASGGGDAGGADGGGGGGIINDGSLTLVIWPCHS